MKYLCYLLCASFASRAIVADQDFMYDEPESQSYVAPAESQPYMAPAASQSYAAPSPSQPYAAPVASQPYAAPVASQQYVAPAESQSYMAPSEVACYECDSEVDGAMCYDSTLITKESRMCGLNATTGGACAVIRVDSALGLTANSQPRSIQRRCLDHCVPGCTAVGSSNELQKCTTCCDSTFCNLSNSSPLSAGVEPFMMAVMISIVSLWSLIGA